VKLFSTDSETSVQCPACGAKNGLDQLCRICGTMLPGAVARRQEGSGGQPFAETVERERGAWSDYSAGRMSADARSRRPDELPTAPPGTWHEVPEEHPALPDSRPELAAPPEPAPVKRPERPKAKVGRGHLVALVLIMLLAIAVGAVIFLKQTDPQAAGDVRKVEAALPVLAGPEGRFAQIDVKTFARTRLGLTIDGQTAGPGCDEYNQFIEGHASAGAASENGDGTKATFGVFAATLQDADAARQLFGMSGAEALQLCLADARRAGGNPAPGATTTSTVTALPAPAVGDEASSHQITFTTTTAGQATSSIVTSMAVRTDRSVVLVFASTGLPDGSPFPPDVLEPMLTKMVDKLKVG
jgi:hypothetical protein